MAGVPSLIAPTYRTGSGPTTTITLTVAGAWSSGIPLIEQATRLIEQAPGVRPPGQLPTLRQLRVTLRCGRPNAQPGLPLSNSPPGGLPTSPQLWRVLEASALRASQLPELPLTTYRTGLRADSRRHLNCGERSKRWAPTIDSMSQRQCRTRDCRQSVKLIYYSGAARQFDIASKDITQREHDGLWSAPALALSPSHPSGTLRATEALHCRACGEEILELERSVEKAITIMACSVALRGIESNQRPSLV